MEGFEWADITFKYETQELHWRNVVFFPHLSQKVNLDKCKKMN